MSKPPIAPNTALSFDGVNAHVDLRTPAALRITRELTIEAWIRVDAQTPWAGILSKIFHTGNTQSGYGLLLDGKHGLYFALKITTDKIRYLQATDVITLGRWTHVAATWDGEHMALYVDGELKASESASGPAIDYEPDNAVYIAQYRDNNEVHPLCGALTEVRLWSVARTPEQLAAARRNRLSGDEAGLVAWWPIDEGDDDVIHDRGPHELHGSFSAARPGPRWVEDEDENRADPPTHEGKRWAMAFDGRSAHVDLGVRPEHRVAGALTLEAHVKLEGPQQKWAGIVSKIFHTGSVQSGYGMLLDGADGLYFGLKTNAGGIHYLRAARVLQPGSWQHVAMTWDGTRMVIYVDGAEVASQSAAGTAIDYEPDHSLSIAQYRDNNEAHFVQGRIAEVRLWSVSRSAAELVASAGVHLPEQTSGLVARWGLDGGHGDALGGPQGVLAGRCPGPRWIQDEVPLDVDGDPISKIEGIGPKAMELLREAGLRTYDQLARATLSRLTAILGSAGRRFALVDPTTWPEQATLAAAGDWSGLKALQDQLDGGRRTE